MSPIAVTELPRAKLVRLVQLSNAALQMVIFPVLDDVPIVTFCNVVLQAKA